jgi:heme exporter protein D|tara:strand:+ start:160 stop:384 length:225 start_codon:yes stop_codon:yes gene_type:complete
MNLELFILDGYGQYVWPAFIFTIVSCFSLYLKTTKEFKKQEKIYLKEFEQLQTIKIEAGKRRETKKEVLSGSSI